MDIDPKLLKEFDKMSQEASGKRVKNSIFLFSRETHFPISF